MTGTDTDVTPPPNQLLVLTKSSIASETRGAHKEEPDDNFSASESDELEAVQPYPIPLNELESIILQSASFSSFREKYRSFLFPQADPESSEGDITPEDAAHMAGSEERSTKKGSDSEQGGTVSSHRSLFASSLRWFRRLGRPAVKKGHARIEWTCVGPCFPTTPHPPLSSG
jgi:hypothetical protein